MRFDLALKEWHITHRDGIVIATVGIGADGHTAGILPMPTHPERFAQLFEKRGICAVGYEHPHTDNPHTQRITTTLYYLETHINHALVYAIGKDKKAPLREAFHSTIDLPSTPAGVLRHMQGVEVFTTQATDTKAA